MKFTIITLFPDAIETLCGFGLLGQAREKGLVSVATVNPRTFTCDVHHTVDDRAFGGGDGMVMKVEPLAAAVKSLGPNVKVSVLSPQGRRWSQADAEAWAGEEDTHRVLVCGRYAGIDQRFCALHAEDEISIGDYVLNGGETAAAVVIESVARLLPGVLGNAESARRDTFRDGRLECPQFTRPREVEGLPVPEPLLSGHHARIAEFERAVSDVRTKLLRPDLLPEGFNIEQSLKLVSELSDPELRSLGLNRADLARVGGR